MLHPLYHKIIIRRIEAPPKTFLYIPEAYKEKADIAEVVAVGCGRLSMDGTIVPLQVRVGDKVIFGKYSGVEFDYAGEKYIAILEDDIHCVAE